MSITTVDGATKKQGDWVFEVGMDLHTCDYVPTRTRLTGKERTGEGSPNYYDNRDLCQDQCRMMNEKPKI